MAESGTDESGQSVADREEDDLVADRAAEAVVENHEDDDLVEITEELADRALARLKREVTLPEVTVDPRQVAATLKRVQSRVLWAAMSLLVAAATVGLLVVTNAGLEDWYMHVGMYIVIFSFFVIYLKAHLAHKRFSRHFYAVLTVGLMAYFAAVLHDLVAPREVLEGQGVVVRAALPLLDVAAGLLVGAAVTFTIHWAALRSRSPRVPPDEPESSGENFPS